MPLLDLKCPFCPKVSTRGTGLASHVRGAHSAQSAAWAASRKAGVAKSATAPKSSSPRSGSSGLGEVIAMLQQQSAAVNAALAALRGVGTPAFSAPQVSAAEVSPEKSGRKKRKMSPEGRARLLEALRRRWAKEKGTDSQPAASRKRGRPRKS